MERASLIASGRRAEVSSTESQDAMERLERRVAIITIIVPFIALAFAIVLFWGKGVSALDLILCGAMYVITAFGLTMGFHRLFTHRSFKCARAVTTFLGVSGSMAAQGPILFWVACHRRHHQCSDEDGDPHSPHEFGGGFAGVLRGWWHAHMGWMLTHKAENYRRLVGDLLRDRQVMSMNQHYFLWIALGLLIPGVLGGVISQTWWGFFTGVLWGGLVRIFLVHHCTWSINSICHLFGSAPFATGDESKNNGLCAMLTMGEGWHNNHHAFPSSARHGLMWWQLDIVYLAVSALRCVGLAWDVHVPSRAQMAARATWQGTEDQPKAADKAA
ncbi:MAG TPA: acyl-CoA desaturase [Candidatus Binatia bacterium]|nr:acyl-CoA desaturase [Candidatus Binatia bacterium]